MSVGGRATEQARLSGARRWHWGNLAFRGNRRGSVAIIFAMSLPVLLGIVGGGIDYARLVTRRAQLQTAVDAGALAGGNTLKLAASDPASVRGVTEQTIRSHTRSASRQPIKVSVEVARDGSNIFVRAEDVVPLSFGRFVGIDSQTVIAQTKVSIIGKMRLCMLTLDPSAPGAFNLQKNAQVTAGGCSLYSNSADQHGMVGGDNSMVRADSICSVGGYLGLRANFAPAPQTGCPALTDPLKDRPAPPVDPCQHTHHFSLLNVGPRNLQITTDTILSPGTYCGGIYVLGNARVRLRPGTYIMKDGPLIVANSATFEGTDVGFYFTGSGSGLLFDRNTTISLSAPTTGVMAGMLLMDDRNIPSSPQSGGIGIPCLIICGLVDPAALLNSILKSPTITPTPPPLGTSQPMRIYRIISDNARTMLGTIYLPGGRVVIDASKPVSDQSAYTVVVALQVNLYEGPNLYLNARYNETSVPVPRGIGPLGGRVVITQ